MRFIPFLSLFILDSIAYHHISQGRETVTHHTHNVKIAGSIPAPAIPPPAPKILARVTFYYPNCDRFGTKSATGQRLKPWKTCAVDPKQISYGSKIIIPDLGEFLAHDTGSDVVNRKAARLSGKTIEQKSAIVIDICVRNEKEMERLSRSFPMFAKISLE